jgi:Nitrate and nitrite sensing/HAMP domain
VDAATLAHELGGERDSSVAWLARGDADGARSEVLTARLRVDGAVRAFRGSAAGPGHSSRDQRVRSRLEEAASALGRLGAARRGVDRLQGGATDAISAYSDITGAVLDVAAALPAGVAHRELARDLDAFVALAQAEELASLERGLGTAAAAAGRFLGRDDQRLAAAMGARRRELARFQATATPAQQELFRDAMDAPRVEHADELEALLLGAERPQRLEVLPQQWLEASGERVEALRTVSRQLGARALITNRAVIVAAEQQLLDNLLLLMIVVVLTFALAVFTARSMINPLVELEQAARDVAERKLPSVVERLHRGEQVDLEAETLPVEVGARGEIGAVAEAFTAVQRVAVSVAVDQAALRQSVSEMFVNMARRSQSLIDRQIALIDQLEKNETNPDQLEQFFRLDHLATRMRRNAESLIVLSGAEPGHRWSQPVPLASLARAAVAEVEDYTRVQILPMEGAQLSGPAGVDVVHLLAELIENATAFSPPDTSVVVAGEAVSSGYLIEIEDRGIGMSDADLLAANERLASPPVADFTLSRMLGFYVIGRLAQRYGIKVQVRHSPYGGVTALVLLPAPMVSQTAEASLEASAAQAVPSRPGRRAARSALASPSRNGRPEQGHERQAPAQGPAPPPAAGPDGRGAQP